MTLSIYPRSQNLDVEEPLVATLDKSPEQPHQRNNPITRDRPTWHGSIPQHVVAHLDQPAPRHGPIE